MKRYFLFVLFLIISQIGYSQSVGYPMKGKYGNDFLFIQTDSSGNLKTSLEAFKDVYTTSYALNATVGTQAITIPGLVDQKSITVTINDENKSIWLTDDGSTPVVGVNGERIFRSVTLNAGSVISLKLIASETVNIRYTQRK